MKADRILKYLFLYIICVIYDLPNAHSSDTIRYESTLNSYLLYEAIELYSNSSFKWTSEYDLNFSILGKYEIVNQVLILKYFLGIDDYKTQYHDGLIPDKIESYEMDGDQLFKLNSKGKRVFRKFDKSLKTRFSWLFGHKYRIKKAEN